MTTLHYALQKLWAFKGNQIIKLVCLMSALIKAGADVHAQDFYIETLINKLITTKELRKARNNRAHTTNRERRASAKKSESKLEIWFNVLRSQGHDL